MRREASGAARDEASGAAADEALRSAVLGYYVEHGRILPWRLTRDPYAILVSEVMLQQTQVPRVIGPYERFLAAFPTVGSLAAAPLADVLAAWSGLGYNRRALALHRAAGAIVAEHGGRVPCTLEGLMTLPGVGHATAAQVLAFAFDTAVPFIETNIRAVYLHHYFAGCDDVPDSALLPIIERTLDRDDPRGWYYALMDYGTELKRRQPNPSRRSRHHTTQSRFEGSNRQLRGRIVRALVGGAALDAHQLAQLAGFSPEAVEQAADALVAEGLLRRDGERYRAG